MKRFFMTLIAGAVLCASVPVFANEPINVGEKLNKMKAELSLTDDQVKAIEPILNDYKSAVEQAQNNKEERLKQVLSADQMNKLKEWKKDMKAWKK